MGWVVVVSRIYYTVLAEICTFDAVQTVEKLAAYEIANIFAKNTVAKEITTDMRDLPGMIGNIKLKFYDWVRDLRESDRRKVVRCKVFVPKSQRTWNT